VTYSIVAVDTLTGEVGGAGTSCLGGSDVFVIYRAVPGRGAVHAQARYDETERDRAAELLGRGQSAAEVLAAITQVAADPNVAVRQYGIVDGSGRALGYTGTATTAFAADVQGATSGFAYSAQGNILTSRAVLEQAAAAFEAGGCDLAERLMRALRAGAEGGEGDSRCTELGIPSDSAFLQVERGNASDASEGDYLALHVASSGSENPLPLLEVKLQAWRSQHPCPVELGTAAAHAGAGAPLQGDSDGCGCHAASAAATNSASCLLLCVLFIVARRRRPARQLHPALLPREQARPTVPGSHHAELCAREIHGTEQ
jgi:uncharacterized Ntn-hydrolase superfamily protein